MFSSEFAGGSIKLPANIFSEMNKCHVSYTEIIFAEKTNNNFLRATGELLMKKTEIVIVCLFIIFKTSLAQEKNWQIIFAKGDKIFNVSPQTMTGDSLFIISSGQTRWVPIGSIVRIKIVKKSKFWQGGGIGFASGAAIGVLFSIITCNKYKSSDSELMLDLSGLATICWGTVGGLTGFITGGVIGSICGIDEVYDLSKMNLQEKKAVIRKILDRNLKNRPTESTRSHRNFFPYVHK